MKKLLLGLGLCLAAGVGISVALRREPPRGSPTMPPKAESSAEKASAASHPAFDRLRAFEADASGLRPVSLRDGLNATVLTAYVHPEGGSRLSLEWVAEETPDEYVRLITNMARGLGMSLERVADDEVELGGRVARRLLLRREDGNHVLLVLETTPHEGGIWAFAATCEDDPSGNDLAVMERTIESFETDPTTTALPTDHDDPTFGVRISSEGIEGPVHGFPMRMLRLTSLETSDGGRASFLVTAEYTSGDRSSDLPDIRQRLSQERREILSLEEDEAGERERLTIDVRHTSSDGAMRERRTWIWDGTILWCAHARWPETATDEDIQPVLDALESFRLGPPAD